MNPKVKVCGITNTEDALMAINAGASFIGIIFAPSSHRQVSHEAAKEIGAVVNGKAQLVGVFQNQHVDCVNEVAQELELDYVQLHGSESPEFIQACKVPVIKTFEYRLTGALKLYNGDKQVQSFTEYNQAQFLLFDRAKKNDLHNEISFETQAKSLLNLIGETACNKPFFIAGGLKAATVQKAIALLNPYGVDVASGVETDAGKKSSLLIQQFLEECKRAASGSAGDWPAARA